VTGTFFDKAKIVLTKNIKIKNPLHISIKPYTLYIVKSYNDQHNKKLIYKQHWRLLLYQSLDLCIRQAYHYLCQRRPGQYSEASQDAIIKILDTIYHVKISRRTLNYHLCYLEDNDEIKRIRRHKKGPYGRIQFHTTLIILKKKATEVLKRLARWFRQNKFNDWNLKGFDLNAPRSEMQATLISTFLKTTSQ